MEVTACSTLRCPDSNARVWQTAGSGDDQFHLCRKPENSAKKQLRSLLMLPHRFFLVDFLLLGLF